MHNQTYFVDASFNDVVPLFDPLLHSTVGQITITGAAAVPEPGGVLFVGLCSLVAIWRRKRIVR